MKPIAKSIGLLVALALVVGFWILHFHSEMVSPYLPAFGQNLLSKIAAAPASGADDTAATGDAEVPVHVAKVEKTTFHRYLDGFGTIVPRPARGDQQAGSASIASPVAGIVTDVACQIGQQVHKGDLLIQLDDRVAKAAEDQAAAGVAQAQASLAALKATPRPEQLDVARLSVEKSQAAVEFAQKSYDREKQLAAEQGTSDKNLQQAALDLSAAQNDLAVNQKQLDILKGTPTQQDLDQENAKVAEAQAALVSAQAQRQLLRVTSPIDATVADVSVNPGEGVDTSRTLVSLVALDRLMADVDLPAEDLAALSVGQDVLVIPDTHTSATTQPTPEHGKVAYISPQVDRKSGAIPIGIDVPAGDILRPGLTVHVRIAVETHEDKLGVPRQSVVTDDDGNTIICLVKDDKSVHQKVDIGLSEDDLTEISGDGVKEGDTVITAGAYGLDDGVKVNVADEGDKGDAAATQPATTQPAADTKKD